MINIQNLFLRGIKINNNGKHYYTVISCTRINYNNSYEVDDIISPPPLYRRGNCLVVQVNAVTK